MSPTLLLFVGLLALVGGVFGCLLLVSTVRAERQQLARSLAAVNAVQLGGFGDQAVGGSFSDRVLVPALGRLSKLGLRLSPTGVSERVQRRLDLAGNPAGWDVERILGAKGFGLLAGGAFGLWLSSGGSLFTLVVGTAGAAAAGLFLPDILLYNAGTKRQLKIQSTLADALDLLTISVEAGLGFDAALAQVARNTDGPLAGEFFRLLQEMQIGKSRADAFRAMSDRSEVQELKSFISSIVQADSLGIPIVGVLREQAKEMRLKRMQRAEEKAMKVPVKILFPTIVFIFPALFVIVLGPGGISIFNALAR